jgi:hypothetical protein
MNAVGLTGVRPVFMGSGPLLRSDGNDGGVPT